MYIRLIIIGLTLCFLSGCVGTAIDTASDAAVSIIKVPFKVVGAVVDGVRGEKKDEEGDS